MIHVFSPLVSVFLLHKEGLNQRPAMDKDAAALVLQARHRQCVEELFDDYAEDFDEHLTSLGLLLIMVH